MSRYFTHFFTFASPPEKDVDWSDDGIIGAFRFLKRVWRLIDNNLEFIKRSSQLSECSDSISEIIKELAL